MSEGRMTAEQTPDIETLRSVVWQTLSEHQWGVWSCSCGEADGEYEDNHLADVIAQALAPVLDAAVREARAAELREAADNIAAKWNIDDNWHEWQPIETPGARIYRGIVQSLRDRADRIAVDAPEALRGDQ